MITNPILLKVKKSVRDICPSALCLASRVASRTVMFRNERAYLRGQRTLESSARTVLFFSTFRCGTQRVDSILRELCPLDGLKPLNLGGYWFHRGVEREGEITDSKIAKDLYNSNGYYFGRIRPIANEFDLSPYRVVSVVRDPRDVMVSYFYSLAFAHTPLNRKYALDAAEARERGLEWFVKHPRRIGVIGRELRQIRDTAWQQEGFLNWKFEDMMNDFPEFVNSLADYLGVMESSSEIRKRIVEKQKEVVSGGGSTIGHFRSGQSGQFREKLSAETVDFLTEEFEDLLVSFGYDK